MSDFTYLADLQLIVYDCDGVLTDNKVIVDEMGHEYASFNRGDGYGIARIKELGIRQMVISTESNPIVVKRCEKLKIEVIYNVENKRSTLIKFCESNNIDPAHTMFIGNDLNDLEAMEIVGIKGCPKNAEPEILKICRWISTKDGGDGVVRELYRNINQTRCD